ncbi:MAG: endonuclease/exonuclease/phosphatase family protein [Candidatus Hydrogenedentes bacterium]|nr:endonuclease/exonuclease/phosphatase family protein [Candidatus Hydrogenedentota bacterium]
MVLLGLPPLILGGLLLNNMKAAPDSDHSKSKFLETSPRPLAQPVNLRIVTFNVHDLYWESEDRPERMRAIADRLTELDPDLVGFQEAFIAADRKVLLAALADSRLKHHHYFRSGTVGSGLFVVSAFPIEEVLFHRYTRNGKWYKIRHGDWWAGKGVALARVRLPDGGVLDFFNTHAHARYGSTEYDVDRFAQMREMADFINRVATGNGPAIALGDFNCRPDSEAYQAIVEGAILQRMMTVDSRIDHIFGVGNDRYHFEALNSESIDGEIEANGHRTELSDHSGYLSTVRISSKESNEQ